MAFERIVLNIIPKGEMPVFHCSQYENGRPVIIDLVSSDDDAFVVPEGASVELHCRKVDDNIVTLEPDEVDQNTVTFVSTEQLTACPGANLCEIVLYSGTDPVQTIATLNFILHVEPDPMEGGLTSETQIYNLTEQIEEITQQVIGDDYYNKTEVDGLLAGKADQATTYTKLEVDTALNLKADKSDTYTKSQVDTALNLKADKSDTYTKTQVDNALAAKANTADLATVATTGDYDDLINKPVIPAAQVQSDYAQEDNTQVDYIKNKPDIDGMIANALLAVMPVGTESGPIATFDTEIAAPLVNVSCDIVATQSGSGTPYPAGGGVNRWNEVWEVGGIDDLTGNNYVKNDRIRSTDYNPVNESDTYYLSMPINGVWVYCYDENKAYISSRILVYANRTFTLLPNTKYIRLEVFAEYGTVYHHDISINLPATDHDYHPYANIRPINGYSSANITRCGVNLWDEELENGQINANTGAKEPTTANRARSVNYIPIKATSTYYCYSKENVNVYAFFYDANKDYIGYVANPIKNSNFTPKDLPNAKVGGDTFDNACFMLFRYDDQSFIIGDCSINYPATDTTYHAYNGQTYAIAFGQTVYGGVLDVTRGKLKPCIEYPSYNGETLSGRWLSSEASYIEGTTPPTGSQVVSLDDYGSDIDLTPEVISEVVGTNNVYSDTNGDTTVQFKDSIQHYIDTRP